MPDLSRRDALRLGAAAIVATVVPPPASAVAATPASEPMVSWIVGTPGEYDWQRVWARTEESAIRKYIAEHGAGATCNAAEGELAVGEECDCEHCHILRSVEVERRPEWDNKENITDVDWLSIGWGTFCARCDGETSVDCSYAVGGNVICDACMTFEDWDVINPEIAAELRAEAEANA